MKEFVVTCYNNKEARTAAVLIGKMGGYWACSHERLSPNNNHFPYVGSTGIYYRFTRSGAVRYGNPSFLNEKSIDVETLKNIIKGGKHL